MSRASKEKLVKAIDLDGGTVLVPESETTGVRVVTDLVPTRDGFLWTPAAARQIGFGWSPFRKYPEKIDQRVVALADYEPPGTPNGKGVGSKYWCAVIVRADGMHERLVIASIRDAQDALFEWLDDAELARLAAPFAEVA